MKTRHFAKELFKLYPRLFIGNIILAALLSIVDAATLASIAPIISSLTNAPANEGISPAIAAFIGRIGLPDRVETYLLVFVGLTIFKSVLMVLINYFILRAQFIVRGDLLNSTMGDILGSSIEYVNKQRQGDFINTLNLEVERVSDAFTALTKLIAPVGQAIILIWIPLLIAWETTVISVVLAILLLVPLRLFQGKVYQYGKSQTQTNNNLTTTLQETLQNARVIIGYANQAKALDRLNATFRSLRDAYIRLLLYESSIFSAHAPIGIIVVFATFVIGKAFGTPLPEIAVVLFAFHRLSGIVATINQGRMQLVSWMPSYEQVMAVRAAAQVETPPNGQRPFESLSEGLTFHGVSFAFGSGETVLKDINLRIPANKMTAIVGPSGAGKSTLADLVMGYKQPTSGEIIIDGDPMSDLDVGSFRQHLGYVPQEISLFNESIRGNIKWAAPDASDEDVREACRLSNADKFISNLPEGLDTIVGDRGVRLSGGQAQRISLARALVRRPTLLILDEATSALDTDSEKMIQAAIEGILGMTTIIAIAHRLSTVKQADNIIVLDQGKVAEQGSFDTLIARDEIFARLVSLQQL